MGEERHHSAYILIHGPGHDGTCLPLREGITSFGRLPSNDLVLLGDLVSRHHTRITFFEGRATLQDLGSHNGSWVNGERVTTRVLKEGDICRVGNFRLSFHPGLPPDGKQPSFDETTNAERGASQRDTDALESSASTGGVRAPSQSVLLQQIEQARAGQGAQAKAMQVLLRASEALASATDLESYMQEMMKLALDQTGAEMAAFIRTNAETRRNEVVSTRGAQRASARADVHQGVVDWTITKNFALLIDDVAADIRFGGQRVNGPLAVLCVPLAQADQVLGAMYISRPSPPFHDGDLDVLGAISHLSSTALTRARFLTESSKSNAQALERVSSPDIAKVLRAQLDAPEPAGLEGRRATVVVADVPGVAALSERASPADVSRFMSVYLDKAHEVATKYQGSVRLMTGAKVLLLFGAPSSYDEDASRGVAAGLELRAAVERMGQQVGNLRVRLAATSGWMLAGPIGTERRLEYGVIGDVVDLARQMEQSAAAGAFLIDEATAQLVAARFELRNLGSQPLKGRAEPHPLYQVVGPKRR